MLRARVHLLRLLEHAALTEGLVLGQGLLNRVVLVSQGITLLICDWFPMIYERSVRCHAATLQVLDILLAGNEADCLDDWHGVLRGLLLLRITSTLEVGRRLLHMLIACLVRLRDAFVALVTSSKVRSIFILHIFVKRTLIYSFDSLLCLRTQSLPDLGLANKVVPLLSWCDTLDGKVAGGRELMHLVVGLILLYI